MYINRLNKVFKTPETGFTVFTSLTCLQVCFAVYVVSSLLIRALSPLSIQAVRLSCWTLMRDSTYYTISVATLIVVSTIEVAFLASMKPVGLLMQQERICKWLSRGALGLQHRPLICTHSAWVPNSERQQTWSNNT